MRSLLLSLLFTLSLSADTSPLTQQLPEWWREAKAEAEKTPVADRKARERELVFMQAEAGKRDERIRQGLLAIALRPQDVSGALIVMGAAAMPRTAEPIVKRSERSADVDAATAFVRDLYPRHAGTESEAALQWQSGYAELLLHLGEFEEALRLQRQVVTRLDQPYKRVLLGVIEAANGKREPLAQLFADCPEGGDADCRTTAISIAGRAQMSLGDRTPPAIVEILTGGPDAAKVSWEDRMHGLHSLAETDPKKGEQELQKVVFASDAPKWAQDSAVFALAQMDHKDDGESVALIDCWFVRNGIEFPPLPETAWEELRTLMANAPTPSREALENDYPCHPLFAGPDIEFDMTSGCTTTLLMRRAFAAAILDDVPLQRETAERAVAVSLATGKPVPLLEQILAFAAMESNDARAMQYVGSLKYPWGEWQPEIREAVRKQTTRVTTPWDGPVVTKPRPTPMCD